MRRAHTLAGRMVAFLLAFATAVLLGAMPARAQDFTYSNTTSGAVNATTICTAPLVREFTVPTGQNIVLGDVDLALLVTHNRRGELRVTLQSPSGTRVQLVNGNDADIGGDNLNVRLSDQAASLVNTDGNNNNQSSTAPPYQNTFRPNNALSAFNGQSSAGTWRLEVCDLRPASTNGTFVRADLYLTSQRIDLSVDKSVSNSAPTAGASISYTVSVTNAATAQIGATGVVVRDVLPAGFTFTGVTGFGSYDPATGLWNVGTVGIGQTRSITISGTVSASPGAPAITNIAEIIAANQLDSDSIVNNGSVSEDDYRAVSFTVSGSRTPGVPPVLSCQRGSVLFDWNAVSWSAGSTSNSYPLGTLGNIGFVLTNPGVYLSNSAYGGQSPTRQNVINGGFSGEFALSTIINLPNRSSEAVFTITLPNRMDQAQFRIFDIDFFADQFADRVQVTGSLGGVQVQPVLTHGSFNYVVGNTAFGDATSSDGSGSGNIMVTFASPIDTITIRYGNHGSAPADPGQQGIALHDMTFCLPAGDLTVAKTSALVTDPVNGATNPKAIPGALLRYTIAVSNTGIVRTESLQIADTVPAGSMMCGLSNGAPGPVSFIDGSPASGLSYSFAGLASTTDALQFSNGGTNWNYTPVPDARGCDAAITAFRVRPQGTLPTGRGFSLTALFMVR